MLRKKLTVNLTKYPQLAEALSDAEQKGMSVEAIMIECLWLHLKKLSNSKKSKSKQKRNTL